MKFIDECNVKVKGGKGGDGIISFRREYRVDKGGPDGGDGGQGGSVYFEGDKGINTLHKVKFLNEIRAKDGEDGRRKNQYGAKGEDIIIKVPLGTLVYQGEQVMFDIVEQKPYLVAKGGQGGRGNLKFKTQKNVAPRLSENGEPGQKFNLRLVLKVLADVGFVGLPSAGKSTLLAKVSNAKPKIADYPFTTLTPQLGLSYVDDNSFVVADLPGLIEGASLGKGLGIEFLKHIERCRVIAHIIDFGDLTKNPVTDYEVINRELASYGLGLEKRKQVLVANKTDLPDFELNLKNFQAAYPDLKVITVSGLKERNILGLKRALYEAYLSVETIEYNKPIKEVTITLADKLIVTTPFRGMFEVEGEGVRQIYDKIPLNSTENFRRFNFKMKELGLWDELRKKGIQNNDTVRIFSYEFSWNEEEFTE